MSTTQGASTPPRRNNSPNQSENKGGRPLGAMSRLAKEARELAQQSGDLPHEILLKMARGEPVATWVDSGKVDASGEAIFTKKYVSLDVEGMRDAAKAAAPYYAPKISTVEVITGVTDAQLDEIIAGAAAEAGFSHGPDGEGEEEQTPSAPRERKRAHHST